MKEEIDRQLEKLIKKLSKAESGEEVLSLQSKIAALKAVKT